MWTVLRDRQRLNERDLMDQLQNGECFITLNSNGLRLNKGSSMHYVAQMDISEVNKWNPNSGRMLKPSKQVLILMNPIVIVTCTAASDRSTDQTALQQGYYS